MGKRRSQGIALELNGGHRVCGLIRVLYPVDLDHLLVLKNKVDVKIQRQKLPRREDRPKPIMEIHSLQNNSGSWKTPDDSGSGFVGAKKFCFMGSWLHNPFDEKYYDWPEKRRFGPAGNCEWFVILLGSRIGLWESGGLPDGIIYAGVPREHNRDAYRNISGRMKGLGKPYWRGAPPW